MKLRRILTVLVFTLMAFQSQATHQLGGEIIWKCKPNGKYQFTMFYIVSVVVPSRYLLRRRPYRGLNLFQ